MKEKFLSFFMCVTLVLCLMPACFNVNAAETGEKTLPEGAAGYVMDVPDAKENKYV